MSKEEGEAKAPEEKDEEEEEDLEKLQAEIERMEAEAARITKETEVICSPANPNGGLVIDEKDPDSEGIVVHRTSDVFQQWAWNRTDDECRLWYLKTLKMRKILTGWYCTRGTILTSRMIVR